VRRSRWLALALLAPVLAACGGDDEPTSTGELRNPPLTAPGTGSTDTTQPTETAPPSTGTAPGPSAPLDQPNPGNGGVPAPDSNAPSTQTAPAPSPPDSPGNDTPPPPGSPAERFEQFCAQNPGAC
jgi:hypothetical protein